MITKQYIEELAKAQLAGSEKFLVDVNVSPGNKIEIYLDAPNGISIKDCVDLSRHVEGSLNRDEEDFSLEVSSPGATEPFKVMEQYKKYIGKEVEVKTLDGNLIKGKLLDAGDEQIVIETKKKENKPIGKGKHLVTENLTFRYQQIKETKSVLPF